MKPRSSTIIVLLVAVGIDLAAMLVFSLMVDLKKLQFINDEINKYKEKMKESQRSRGRTEIRRARREEALVKIMSTFSAKQRLRACAALVTIFPFAAIFFIPGSLYVFRYVAQVSSPTPLGRDIPFHVWYSFCYFATYLPLTRIFGPSIGATMLIGSNLGGI